MGQADRGQTEQEVAACPRGGEEGARSPIIPGAHLPPRRHCDLHPKVASRTGLQSGQKAFYQHESSPSDVEGQCHLPGYLLSATPC